jgi:hypothetical protein
LLKGITFDGKTNSFELLRNNIMNLNSIVLLFLLCSPVIVSQADTLTLSQEEIQSLVNEISVKLLLDDSQIEGLSKILLLYSAELTELRSEGNYSFDNRRKLIDDLDIKIQNLFDYKQKMKYEIIKDDWLESVKFEEND